MVESLQMAFAATLVGVVLSVPLGIAAARNLAPRIVYLAARGLIVVGRTFHEVIIAIFFVKLFGFGPVAGLITLAFSSTIFLAKMLAEDIENVRVGPIEALRATGAGFGQVVVYAVVPQVLTRSVGTAIYRLDANVRHSTIVGIVGAGGIGQTLSASFSRYDYDFAAAILLCDHRPGRAGRVVQRLGAAEAPVTTDRRRPLPEVWQRRSRRESMSPGCGWRSSPSCRPGACRRSTSSGCSSATRTSRRRSRRDGCGRRAGRTCRRSSRR